MLKQKKVNSAFWFMSGLWVDWNARKDAKREMDAGGAFLWLPRPGKFRILVGMPIFQITKGSKVKGIWLDLFVVWNDKNNVNLS